MQNINKQQAGFKFGQHRLEVIKLCGEVAHNGRTYKLLVVKTHDGLLYNSLRLYNGKGKFIKQFLFEDDIAEDIGSMILDEALNGCQPKQANLNRG